MKQYNYNKIAEYYDVLELKGSKNYEKSNEFLDKIFKKNKVKTVLDMTCGTGAQSIGLARKGYKVTASDISKGMLNVAKKKADNLKIKFCHGDIRTSKYGKFDAGISIFNDIGHLTKKDFKKALKNVSSNLKDNGLFIFDIFNLDFMSKNFKYYEFIDTALEHNNTKFVRFNKNNFDINKGIMRINQKVFIQKSFDKPRVLNEKWDMQIYAFKELKELLKENSFKIEAVYGGPWKKFDKNKPCPKS